MSKYAPDTVRAQARARARGQTRGAYVCRHGARARSTYLHTLIENGGGLTPPRVI